MDPSGFEQTSGRGKMKTLKWVVLAALVSTTPVWAGDVTASDNYDWSGLYAGIDLGYEFGGAGHLADSYCDGVTPGHCVDNDATSPNFGLPGTWIATTEVSDLIGGGHLGFNRQFDGGFVLGAEMDLGFGGKSVGSFTFGGNFPADPNFPYGPDNDAIGIIDLGLTGSARLRAGYAVDRFLPYVTGGVAYASYDATYIQPDDSNAPRSGKGSFLGWTVGAGLDYAITENILVGAEYRFTKYGSDDLGLTNAALDSDTWSHNADLETHDIRMRASLKF
jgi:outer membrane immunogenic protein